MISKEEALILVIDDNPMNLRFIGHVLLEKGYEAAAALNGDGALDFISKNKPDLVLLDIMMPDMDGYEVCRKLKARTSTKDIPVIFLTAKTETQDIVKGFDVGGVDYVTKPFNASELLARVKTHLELKRYRDHLEDLVQERTAELEKARIAAEAANEAKSHFLANISHELRTPMNGVILSAELALAQELSPGTEKYLKIIRSSGQSLLVLINDILDFSKIEADELNLEKNPFNLTELLERIGDIFVDKAIEKGIELLIEIKPETPADLIGDPLRLQQIITKLIDNAIKFSKKGDIITIGVTGLKKTSDRVVLEFFVKDTGIGMNPEFLSNLFQPFTQADTGTARKYSGLGLGLTISRQLAEMMNGNIRAESEPGKGTTFFLTVRLGLQDEDWEKIPDRKQEKDITSKASGYMKYLKGIRVLVADDDPTNQEIGLAVLERAGIEAEIASDGKEAVAAVRRRRFDIVLMDIQMPVMDGYEATKAIRDWESKTGDKNKAEISRVPVIAMTANAMKGDEERCLKAGMDGYLTKPINQKILLSTFAKFVKPEKAPHEKAQATIETEFGKAETTSEEPVIQSAELPESLPGIEIQRALNTLSISEVAFKKILLGFRKRNTDKLDKMQDAFDQKDWKSLMIIAHSLKGNGANIGANTLREQSHNLEMASKDGDVIPPGYELVGKVKIALKQVLDSLQTLEDTLEDTLETEPSENKEIQVDAEKLGADLKLLADSIEFGHPKKIQDHLEAVRKHLGNPVIRDLEDQLNNYDYDGAMETLERIAVNQAGKKLIAIS